MEYSKFATIFLLLLAFSFSEKDLRQTQIVLNKPASDQRQYLALVLSNKIKVLFIRNTELLMGGCSFSLAAGRLLQKKRSKGLAHFLQHVVFLGTKSFPGQNQFSSFVRSRSGFDNAFTSDIQTNYQIYVDNEYLFQVIQRLAQFFVAPLFRKQSLKKQIQAVHNQFSINVGDQDRRKWQLLRTMGSPPFSIFNMGNNQTLKFDYIRDDLIQFHKKFYSANLITVAIISRFQIDLMKQKIIPILKTIPNKNVQLPFMGKHFQKIQTGRFIRMESIKNQTTLQFFWIVNFLRPHYKRHVTQYIQKVIGYQGRNSLIQLLTLKKYAYRIVTFFQDNKPQTIIDLQVFLTNLGKQNYEQVYNIVLDYIQSLTPLEYIYQQIAEINKANYLFKEVQPVQEETSSLASKMQYIPLKQILNYSIIFNDFNTASKVINKTLKQMNSQNLIFMLSSPEKIKDPDSQQYFKVKYVKDQLPYRQNSGFKFLPIPKNPFIPIDTTLNQFQQFNLIPTEVNQNLYILQDSSYKSCKGGVQIRVYSNQDSDFIQFYAGYYLKALLKQYTSPAQYLSTSVSFQSADCLILNIFGFTDVVAKLIDRITSNLERIHNSKISQRLFQVALNDNKNYYLNIYNKNPDSLSDSILQILLNKRYNTFQQTLKKLKYYNYKQITQRIKKFWQNCLIKAVVVGNFNQEKFFQIFYSIQKNIISKSKNITKDEYKCLKVQNKKIKVQAFIQSKDVSTSGAIVYYQLGPYEHSLYFMALILKQAIGEPYYNELRTIKQIAYNLNVDIDNTRGVLGLKFSLMSSSRDPKNISEQIKQFANRFYSKLDKMLQQDEQLFTNIKNTVTNTFRLSANYQSFYDFIRSQISKKTFNFDMAQSQNIDNMLNSLKIKDLMNVWQKTKNNVIEIFCVGNVHLKQYKKRKVNVSKLRQVKDKAQYYDDYFY